MNYYALISTILFFGLLGGLVNAIRTNQERKDYWKSLVKGVVASFLVPVFLEIIKSDLGKNLSKELYDYIIFGGLCLIAAIFSDKFIDTIGQKILRKAEKAEKIAKESNEKIETVIDRNAEPDEDEESLENRMLSLSEFIRTQDEGNINGVIKSLKSDKYEYRTISGIAKDTGLTKPTVSRMLQELKQKEIVTSVSSGKRTLWTIKK